MNDLSWIQPTLKLVASGALQTLVIALVSVAVSVVLGVMFGVLLCLPQGRMNNVLRLVLTIYLQAFRGLPVLVTLFIVFFISPSLGLQLASGVAAVVGLTLWGSANVMEVVRGAVRSIPTAQFEAASALGFPWRSIMRLVILPQAIRRMLPPVVNLTVDLIQATTLASLIGVVEVLQRSRQAVEYYQLNAGNGHATPIFASVFLFFFLICYPLTLLAGRMERRTQEEKAPATDNPSRTGPIERAELPSP
jgi:polar amino acid transport system permease protein